MSTLSSVFSELPLDATVVFHLTLFMMAGWLASENQRRKKSERSDSKDG